MDNFRQLKAHILPIMLLLVATAAVYAQALNHEFLINWDDQIYVTGNDAVKGFTAENLRTAFSTFFVGNYAPLHIISYMIDYSIWGMRPMGFILSNISLHILNGLLFYALMIRYAGRRIWAFLAGFIFLIHPVQVESVAWISQRKNLLGMFFFLISLLLFATYRDKDRSNRKIYYAASIISFILSLLAKPVAVILPLVLIVDHLCHRQKQKDAGFWPGMVPYFVIAASAAAVALRSQSPELGGGMAAYHGGTPFATFMTMQTVLLRYLQIIFWPSSLSVVYNTPVRTGVDGMVILSLLALTAIMVGMAYLYRHDRRLLFWPALFFIGLLPVAQIVPIVTLMNDRYLYFPMLGASAFIAWLAVSLEDRTKALPCATIKTLRYGLMFALLCLTFNRVDVWQNSTTLWADAFSKNPDSVKVCCNLGYANFCNNRLDEALPAYQKALSLDPQGHDTLLAVTSIATENKEFFKAWSYLQKLVKLYPDSAQVYRALGNFHLETGNLAEAENAYSRSLALQPGSGQTLQKLGIVYHWQGKDEPARNAFNEALRTQSNHAELHYNLACIESASGRSGEALSQLEAAFEHKFDDFTLVESDQDLDRIRSLPGFRHLVAKYVKRPTPPINTSERGIISRQIRPG